ncbi:MAG: AAA family ATPase [Candidatus Aenigmatarchaeota archaeon]
MDDNDSHYWLDEYLTQNPKIGVVIIDCWTDVIQKIDENKAVEIDNLLSKVKRLCIKHGIVLVIVHHLRKGLAYATD